MASTGAEGLIRTTVNITFRLACCEYTIVNFFSLVSLEVSLTGIPIGTDANAANVCKI